MPQMSPLLWTIIITLTISLLLIISSFLYFMNLPSPNNIYNHSYPLSATKPITFIWLW